MMKVGNSIVVLILLSLLVFMGCSNDDSSDPDPKTPMQDTRSETRIMFSGGSNQSGFINEELLDSIEITVLDSMNTPIPELQLTISGDGAFEASNNSTSDAEGKLKVKWTLGNRYFNQLIGSFEGDSSYKPASKFVEVRAIYREPCN